MKLVPLDFVRGTYWLGAFVDIGAAVRLLLPTSARVLGIQGMRQPGAAGRPAITAALLMLGFAAVLIWAHLRTRERRGVLAIALAVIAALASANVVYGVLGAVPWQGLIASLVIQAVLAIMFVASIVIARRAAMERGLA